MTENRLAISPGLGMGTGQYNSVHVDGTAETEGLCKTVPATIKGH